MTLQEAKLVLDWAKERVDIARGSTYITFESFQKISHDYHSVKDLYDKMCEDWIKNNVENKQLNNPCL